MSLEEALLNLDWVLDPWGDVRRITIDPASVSFGKEIPDEEFGMEWPVGTAIWDEFAQVGYTVGGDGEMLKDIMASDMEAPGDMESAGESVSPVVGGQTAAEEQSADTSEAGQDYRAWAVAAVAIVVCLAALAVWRRRGTVRSDQ
jgi:hypothetical protein